MAVNDPKAFDAVVDIARKALPASAA